VRQALRQAARVLALRDFRLVFAAYATSVFGDFVVPVALAFAVLDLTGSATDLGLVLGARVLPIVLFALVGGVWADRLRRQRVIVASNLVRGGTQTVLAVLLVAGVANVWEIVALQLAHGAATAFSRPAGTGLVADVVPRDRLQQANALLFLTLGLAGIAGPAASGVLVTTVGPGWALLVDAGTFFIAAGLLLGVRAPARRMAVRTGFVGELAAGWREVRSRRWLWASIADFAIFQLVNLSAFLVLGPIVAKESLGGAGAWALIATAFGLGTALGNLLALRVEPERPLRTTFLLIFLTVPSLILLGLEAPALAIAGAEVVGGLAVGYAGAVWETTLQRHVPREALSRVSAYDWLGSTALRPIGFALVGPIAVAIGTEATLFGAAALSAISTALVLSVGSVRRLHGRPAEPREDEAEADTQRVTVAAST
jgi:MFS family permease